MIGTLSGRDFETVISETLVVVGDFGLAFFFALKEEAFISELLGHFADAAGTEFLGFLWFFWSWNGALVVTHFFDYFSQQNYK